MRYFDLVAEVVGNVSVAGASEDAGLEVAHVKIISFSSIPLSLYLAGFVFYVIAALIILVKAKDFKDRSASYCRVGILLSLLFFLYGAYLLMLLWDVPFSMVFTQLRKGEFGDSFGTLNALFSGLAFSGVLITLLFQRKDLSETRKQIACQQVESQFYNMLSQQQEVVRGLDLQSRDNHEVIARGRDCFREWNETLRGMYQDISTKQSALDPHALSYGCLFEIHKSDLGVYYRSLYSVFRYVESCGHDNSAEFGRVLRSLLSDYELVLIFYNCLTEKGDRFKRFVYAYALFDNLDPDLLLKREHLRKFKIEAYGSNEKLKNLLS